VEIIGGCSLGALSFAKISDVVEDNRRPEEYLLPVSRYRYIDMSNVWDFEKSSISIVVPSY
jgi:hypothetical protein